MLGMLLIPLVVSTVLQATARQEVAPRLVSPVCLGSTRACKLSHRARIVRCRHFPMRARLNLVLFAVLVLKQTLLDRQSVSHARQESLVWTVTNVLLDITGMEAM